MILLLRSHFCPLPFWLKRFIPNCSWRQPTYRQTDRRTDRKTGEQTETRWKQKSNSTSMLSSTFKSESKPKSTQQRHSCTKLGREWETKAEQGHKTLSLGQTNPHKRNKASEAKTTLHRRKQNLTRKKNKT